VYLKLRKEISRWFTVILRAAAVEMGAIDFHIAVVVHVLVLLGHVEFAVGQKLKKKKEEDN
jgi:hypothetical protein